MCGIAGFWSKSLDLNSRDSIVKAMTDKISHRGPDGSGYYHSDNGVSLGHRRLSIIDLSNSGSQPMLSDDENYVITYNGEVYNYIELKNDLIKNGVKFYSNTDTEVVLKGYIYYGLDFVSKLNGMFAFVILDKKLNRLFAFRDRVGIKPLYYFSTTEKFIFSSEIKSILAYPGLKLKPNWESIRDYFSLSFLVDNSTWFESVYKLEQGSFIELNLNNGSLYKRKYWSPTINIDYNVKYENSREELKSIIQNSVQSHQVSDVEVGSHLSGGVDSSTIVSLISKNRNVHTFSSAFSGLGSLYDETSEIDIVVRNSKSIHHQITTDPIDIISDLKEMTYIMDEPDAGPATLPMFYVNKLINSVGIKVVNGGQGVDELFGGYPPSFYYAAINNIGLIKKGISVPLREAINIPNYLAKYYVGVLRNKKSTKQYKLWRLDRTNESISKYVEVEGNLQKGILGFEKNLLMSLKYYLPALLHQEDRMSMFWSIESRVPFLDNRVIDFALKTPSYFKIKNGTTKFIFKDSVRGLVPDQILNNKKKRGYPTPIKLWFRNQMSEFVNDFLKADTLHIHEIFRKEVIVELLADHQSGFSDNSNLIWKMINLELWLKINFD